MTKSIDVLAALDAELAAIKKESAVGEPDSDKGEPVPPRFPLGSPSGSPYFSNKINYLEEGGTGGTEKHKTRDTTRPADTDERLDLESKDVFSNIKVSCPKTVPPVPPNRKAESLQGLNGGTGRGTGGGTARLGELERRFPEAVSLACRSPVTLRDWRAWMGNRLRDKVASGHFSTREAALTATWEDAERAWHAIYGEPTPTAFCGGCGEVLKIWEPRITVMDRSRVHGSQDCLEAYAERCREKARAALIEIGLKPPN